MTPNFLYNAVAIGTINDPLGGATIWGVVTNGLNTILPLAGILFVGIFIYAGISYMLSTGDPGKVKLAQAMMTNAVIGFVIISTAFVILALVQKGLGTGGGGSAKPTVPVSESYINLS